ncbi:MAG: hypothetical protein WBG70_16075 [Spirulinaceae cyanobacterium]
MTKRKKLADLVKQETGKAPVGDLEKQTSEVANHGSNEVTKSGIYGVPESDTYRVAKSSAPKVPKYLTLVRKETRITEDQLDQLTTLARKLNRAKKGGERITENTLIRVAIDLLLAQDDRLQGATEAELFDSIQNKK